MLNIFTRKKGHGGSAEERQRSSFSYLSAPGRRIRNLVCMAALLLFSAEAWSQTTVTITNTGTAGSFNSGSVNSSGTKNDGNMVTLNTSASGNRGWAEFDLTSIPAGADVTAVTLNFTTYTSTSSTAANNIYGFTGDAATMSGTALYTAAASGSSFDNTSWTANANNTKTLNAAGVTFIEANAGGFVNIGFVRGSTNTYNIYGYSGTTPPSLVITYIAPNPCTSPPTAGTLTPSATTVCSGGNITLNLSGNSTGLGQTYQFQQSPTGAAGSFTDISGATGTTYSGTQTATTFYRAAITCNGNTSYTPTVEVNTPAFIPTSTFTINKNAPASATNFTSFQSAVNAISCGISGPITFNVVAGSGPYTEQVTIPQITGTSDANQIIFNGNDETISFSAANTTDPRHVFMLNGADYVTIDNFTINSDGGSAGFSIHLMNGANNNTISNNTIISSTTSTGTAYANIVASGSATSATADGASANNTLITGNTIIGGYYGISLVGNGSTGMATNNQVVDNVVRDFYLYGVHLDDQQSALISDNDINRATRTSTSTFYGVYLSGGASNGNLIEKNRIHDTNTANPTNSSQLSAVYITGADATAGSPNQVINNAVYNFNGTGTIYAFYNSSSDYVQYYHNSISLDETNAATSSVTYGLYQVTTATGLEIKNNIFSITRGGTGNRRALHFNSTGASSATFTASNNVLYVNSATGTNAIAYVNPTTYNTLTDWQNAGFGAGSVAENPLFQNTSTGDLTPTNASVDNIGTFVGVTEDILDNPRDNTQPDAGAYEFTIPVCTSSDGGTATASVTTLCGSGNVTITNSGFASGAGIAYEWESSTDNFATAGVSTGQMNPASFSTGTITATTSYRLRVTCSSTGTTGYSNVITVTVNPNPVVGISASATTYCSPSATAITLTASGADSYSWTPSTGLSATTGSTVQASPTGTTSYTVTGTDANGCQDTEAVTITVNAAPVINPTATPAAVCAGGSTQLSAGASCPAGIKITEVTLFRTGTGATSPYPSYVVGDDFVEISNLGTSPYNVGGFIFEYYTGTTLNRSYTIPAGTILPANGVMVLAVRTGTDSPANLFFNTGGTNDPLSSTTLGGFVLKKGSEVIDAVASNGYSFPAISGVTAADFSGTIPSSSTRAGISRSNATDTNNATDWVVANTPSPLQTIGTYNGGFTTVENECTGYTYAWSPSTNLSSSTVANPTASNLTSTTTYSVTVTAPNGCASTGSVTVTAGTPLAVSGSPASVTICEGASTNLTAVVSGGGAPFNYNWTGPNGFTSSTTGATAVSNSVAISNATSAMEGAYTVTVTDACGGSQTATITLTLTPLPVVSASSNSPVCTGTSLNLTGTANIGNTFTWTGPNSFTSTSQNPSISNVTTAAAGTYTFRAFNNGCSSAIATTTVQTSFGITSASASSSPATVCSGTSVNLSSSAVSTGYTMDTNCSTGFIDISGTGTSVGAISDDSEHNITLPFAFTFNGTSYTTARVGVNGGLIFGATTGEVSTGACLPSSSMVPGVAIWWDDLDISTEVGATTTLKTQQVGSVFVIQWTDVAHNNFLTGKMMFQIQLEQTTNKITFVYPDVTVGSPSYDAAVSGTVGLNFSSTSALQYSCNTASLVDGQCISFTPVGITSYAWIGPNGFTSSTQNPVLSNVATTDAGTYQVTFTNSNGCTSSASTTLTVNPSPSVTTSQTNVSCNSGSNGAATATVSSGTSPFTYAWAPSGGTAATASGLSAGTYTVTVTDANGCTDTESVIITEPAALVASISASTNVSCFGGSNGSATVSATGGTGAMSYSWSNGATTATASGLMAGTYTVTVTDANGCTDTETVTITQPASAVSAAITAQTNVSCNGGSNGSATVSATGGTGAMTYAWSNGQTTATATGLMAGTYTVTVTDANGCSDTESVTITAPSAVVASIASSTNVSCNGGANGSATASATGGTGAMTYAWSNGATTATATGLMAGTYTVTVTDANGCTDTETVTITQPAAVVASITSSTNVSCNGGSNGSATVSATGGTGAMTYSWSNGATTASITGLMAGTYTVTVTDANGCIDTESVTITQPASAVSAAIIAQTNVSCNGGSNGSATASATGGTGAMTYAWSNGATTATATGLMAGTYTVTVTDANGCTDTESVTISAPSAVVASVTSTNVTTAGGSNGTATASASGGTGAYTYSWSNGATTASITGLSAGTYTVTVTDANGCTDTESVTITSPSCAMTAAISASSNVSCNGGSNGSATVSLTSGTAPYTYAWSNGQTTATATGLMAGSYTVTVTDANGCTAAATATITQPAAALAATATAGSVSCNGGANGIASVTATGGTGAYTYLWSNGATTDVVTGLSAGTYTVTVTDANGCTDTETVTITQPAAVVASITSSTNATCNGATNGAATVAATGGTGTMSYLWSNGDTTATVTGLMAGTYTVTVTDDNGCQDTESVTITQPAAVVASIASSTNVSCNGGANGSATASATGGTGAMTYAWSNGATTATATGLMAGTYTVTVTDANGCTDTESVTISAPSAVVASVTSTNVTTAGGSNGTATASASGGTGAYTYSWSNGATTASITGLSAGTYTVTVTDANGCTDTESVTITSPSCAMTAAISASSNVSCNGGSNGSATVSLTSGTAPYTYAWSNGQTTATATGLMAGSYTVTVTDANGCTAAATATITQPAALVASISGSANVSCNGGSNGTATVGVSGGTGAMTYAWSNGQTTLTATGLMAGTYTVTVTDANGCTDTESVTITQPAAVVASIASSSNVSCNGGANGSATASASGGTGAITYSWSNGQTTATATGLMAGTYTVTVTDANGCTDTETVTITQPAAVVVSASADQGVCPGGSATLTASGADSYVWMPGNMTGSTITVTPSATTTYTVTGTVNGCSSMAMTTVTVNPAPVATASSNSPVNFNATIMLSATGGSSYSWSGPNGFTSTAQNPQIQNATNANAGVYNVTVTSAQGCSSSTSVTVSIGSVLLLTIDQTQPATSTNFTSFGAAASYLNTTGVSSQVIIDVVAGTGPYVNQQMLLGQIPGSSASNTVTINGNGNTISLCSGDPLNRDIIRLDGTDNLILNGLVISAGCGNGWGIHMMNGNENVTLSNNTINLNAANSIYGANMQGIIAANSNTATGAMAGVLNDVTITGNTINNGYNGIRINGNSATWANNLTISGNTLNSTVYFGIITSYTNNLTVNGNMVSMKNVAQNQDIHSIGIQLSYVESGLSVRANRVINAGKQALFLNFINQSSSTRGMVANNMLGGGFRFGQAMAMQVNYASYLDLYYNSVNLDFGTGYALFVSNAASTDLRVVNNSFAYTGTSTGRAMHANGANANFLVLNYNNYYSTGQFVWFNGMLRNDLAALQASMEYGTVAHDMNSWAVNPMYVSATDLHIDAASQLRNKALELPAIMTDYDGNVRPNPATIGADEYTAPNPRQSDSVAGIVYPNPFRAEVSVQLESGEGAVAVELIDMMGRRVYSTTASMANGTVRVQPQVAEGVYMLQLTKDGITTQYRVVKQ